VSLVRRQLDLSERTTREEPQTAHYHFDLAAGHHDFGDVLKRAGHMDEVAVECERDGERSYR
jgi:hypothetical protein